MKPPTRQKIDFEKVKTDEWIPGTISEIQYNMEYKSAFEGKEKTGPAVRFKLALEGYQWPRYTRWMTFSYGEKSNLYKKYLSQLVEGATPDMDFDLDSLKGMPIKTMWANNDNFQNLEMIRPMGTKVSVDAEPHDEEEADKEISFP